MTLNIRVIALTVAVGCALSSCTSPATPRPSTSTSTARPSATVSEWADDGTVTEPRPSSTLVLDPAAVTTATRLAVTALSDYASPSTDADTWWRRLQPLLSQQAATAYYGTDPAQVPALQVTGTASLTTDSSEMMAKVLVPTDHGVWTVIVSRTPELPTWVVERFVDPRQHK